MKNNKKVMILLLILIISIIMYMMILMNTKNNLGLAIKSARIDITNEFVYIEYTLSNEMKNIYYIDGMQLEKRGNTLYFGINNWDSHIKYLEDKFFEDYLYFAVNDYGDRDIVTTSLVLLNILGKPLLDEVSNKKFMIPAKMPDVLLYIDDIFSVQYIVFNFYIYDIDIGYIDAKPIGEEFLNFLKTNKGQKIRIKTDSFVINDRRKESSNFIIVDKELE